MISEIWFFQQRPFTATCCHGIEISETCLQNEDDWFPPWSKKSHIAGPRDRLPRETRIPRHEEWIKPLRILTYDSDALYTVFWCDIEVADLPIVLAILLSQPHPIQHLVSWHLNDCFTQMRSKPQVAITTFHCEELIEINLVDPNLRKTQATGILAMPSRICATSPKWIARFKKINVISCLDWKWGSECRGANASAGGRLFANCFCQTQRRGFTGS